MGSLASITSKIKYRSIIILAPDKSRALNLIHNIFNHVPCHLILCTNNTVSYHVNVVAGNQ